MDTCAVFSYYFAVVDDVIFYVKIKLVDAAYRLDCMLQNVF